jgi:hypothetical protein
VWFGESERTTATAIASTANGLGTTIGFLNPLWLSTTVDTIPNIFWLSLSLSVLPFACGLLYLPAEPPSPPSAAAAASSELTGGVSGAVGGEAGRDGKDEDEGGNDGSTQPKGWCQTVVRAGSNRSFVLLVVASSLLAGVASGWQGLFQAIMEPAGYEVDIKFSVCGATSYLH